MWPLSYGNSLQMSIGASTFWVMTITCIFSLYAWRCHEWKCMLAVELGWLFRVEVACHFLVYSGLFVMEQIVTYLLRVCPREEPSYLSMEKSVACEEVLKKVERDSLSNPMKISTYLSVQLRTTEIFWCACVDDFMAWYGECLFINRFIS